VWQGTSCGTCTRWRGRHVGQADGEGVADEHVVDDDGAMGHLTREGGGVDDDRAGEWASACGNADGLNVEASAARDEHVGSVEPLDNDLHLDTQRVDSAVAGGCTQLDRVARARCCLRCGPVGVVGCSGRDAQLAQVVQTIHRR
jgi:hypothetical protein